MTPILVFITVLVTILYCAVMFLSFLLNGSIVLVFILSPELRTPINLIVVHLSVVSLIPTVLTPFTLAAFLLAIVSCGCSALYYRWIFWQIFLFGIYPFNIVLLTISYLLVIKFSGSCLTIRRVVVSIVLMWTLSILINSPTPIITPAEDYIDCCQTVCLDGSAPCNGTHLQTFTPRTLNPIIVPGGYYNYRDLLVLILPTVIILLASLGSYYIFKRSSIRSSTELELRMLLLPIIMTVCGGPFFLVEDLINWLDTSVDDDRFPGIIVYAILYLFWDVAGIVFGLIILFFNVSIRKKIYRITLNRFRVSSEADPTDVKKSIKSDTINTSAYTATAN